MNCSACGNAVVAGCPILSPVRRPDCLPTPAGGGLLCDCHGFSVQPRRTEHPGSGHSLACLCRHCAIFTGLFGALVLHGIFGNHFGNSDFNLGWSPFGSMWLASLWPMALFSLLTSVCCILLTGYALLTRQPWGRILAIVFGILALIHFPLGTALGIYTLWVLAPRASGDEYAALA